jgi:putative FmdB family regulatory protein
MPLYDYKCAQCGKIVEVRHGFNERHGEPCPACGGSLARVFNPAPIVFKGSGFYVTDSRKRAEKPLPSKTEPAKGEPAKSEPAKSEPAKSDSAKSEPPSAGAPSAGASAGDPKAADSAA